MRETASCADLIWNPNGAGGGNGAWSDTAANWFNGSQNVVWPSSGGGAVFGGPAGTVSVTTSFLTVDHLTFNTPGYILDDNSVLEAADTGLTITTNADATVNTTIFSGSGTAGRTVRKNGAGTLTVKDLFFFDVLQLQSGNVIVTQASLGTAVAFSTTIPTSLTLTGNFTSFNADYLDGGTTGTYISSTSSTLPNQTLALSSSGVGTYAGVIRDNGSSHLGVSKGGSGTQVFTAANPYSGATSVSGGTLTFTGAGSAINTSAVNVTGGELLLDNTATNDANRLSDTAPLTLAGGTLRLKGGSAAPATETLGPLTPGTSHATISVQPHASQPATLTFASFTPAAGGPLIFLAPGLGMPSGPGVGSIRFATAPPLTGGGGAVGTPTVGIILGSFGGDTTPTGFVTYDVNGVRPLTSVEYLENTFDPNGKANVRLTDEITLTGTASAVALRLESGSKLTSDGPLEITTGLIFGAAGAPSSLTASALNLSGGAPTILNEGELLIDSPVSGGTTGFRKTGAGRLILSQANTYTGRTVVDQGILRVGNSGSLGASALSTDGTTVLSGATLELGPDITIGSEALSITGAGAGGHGALRSLGGNTVFGGAITGSPTIGVDAGTLSLTGSYSGTTLVKVGDGLLQIPRATALTSSSISGGTVRTTANASAFPGQTVFAPFGTSVTLTDAALSFAPSGSGSDVSLAIGNTASSSGFVSSSALTFSGATRLALARGAQDSLSLTIGSTGSLVINSQLQRGSLGTLILAPSSGELGSGENVKLTSAPTLRNGIVSPAIVLQRADGQASASFLTYSSTVGFLAATPSAGTNLQTAGSTAVFAANTPQSLTASASVDALINNGQDINLGSQTLTIGSSSSSAEPNGLILNGGVIRGGNLSFGFSGQEGVIYTSLAGATIASSFGSSNFTQQRVTLFGPGTLSLSGNSNLGQLNVTSGTANLTGSISGSAVLNRQGRLIGTGNVGATLRGGLISPGDEDPGILSAARLDPGTAPDNPTAFAFELRQLGAPVFGSRSASQNDVLRLTSGSTAFTSSLTAENEVDIYLNVSDALQPGDLFRGGLYVNSTGSFAGSIQDATYHFYLSDALGSIAFEGSTYSPLTDFDVRVSTVFQPADFGSGTVNGYIMQLEIVPEPTTPVLLALSLMPFAFRRRRTCRSWQSSRYTFRPNFFSSSP